MKNTLLLVIVFALTLLTACTKTENVPTVNTSPSGYVDISIPNGSHSSLEEYRTFIATDTRLREDFVYYEDLSLLGDFRSLVCLNFDSTFCFNGYMYSFIDANEFIYATDVMHYIDNNELIDSLRRVSVTEDMESMKSIAITEGAACIERCDLQYLYSGGKLICIRLYTDNMTYTFSFTYMNIMDILEYPLDAETTFVSRLLSMDDEVVNAAVAEFLENVPQ